MKITTNILKRIIQEEIKNLREQPVPAPEAAPTAPTAEDGDPAGDVQALRKELVNAARTLTGINAQELPFIKVALSIIQKAKEGNINIGALKSHLTLVQKDLQKVQ
jgi:hypothetical protein